jgi:hypothetical protein
MNRALIFAVLFTAFGTLAGCSSTTMNTKGAVAYAAEDGTVKYKRSPPKAPVSISSFTKVENEDSR